MEETFLSHPPHPSQRRRLRLHPRHPINLCIPKTPPSLRTRPPSQSDNSLYSSYDLEQQTYYSLLCRKTDFVELGDDGVEEGEEGIYVEVVGVWDEEVVGFGHADDI